MNISLAILRNCRPYKNFMPYLRPSWLYNSGLDINIVTFDHYEYSESDAPRSYFFVLDNTYLIINNLLYCTL